METHSQFLLCPWQVGWNAALPLPRSLLMLHHWGWRALGHLQRSTGGWAHALAIFVCSHHSQHYSQGRSSPREANWRKRRVATPELELDALSAGIAVSSLGLQMAVVEGTLCCNAWNQDRI
eukprot:791699-Pelagomonas_calceolata.AAC.13